MSAWRISFVREYDLEPVLKSRALGRWTASSAHTFYFQHTTQHHSAYPAWEIWNDAARLLHECLVVDETVSLQHGLDFVTIRRFITKNMYI
jgi:hypothetical protein